MILEVRVKYVLDILQIAFHYELYLTAIAY